jgi:hypothetical protein
MSRNRDNEIRMVSEASVPGNWILLGQYEWLDDFLKLELQRAELAKLRGRKRELKKIPYSKSDLKGLCKTQYAKVLNERRERIQSHFLGASSLGQTADIFTYVHLKQVNAGWPILLPLEEVIGAIDAMPEEHFESAMSRKDLAALLDKLHEREGEIETRIKELSPEVFFKERDGRRRDGDLRYAFVGHWQGVQGRCCEACSPMGIILEKSSGAEQAAWSALEIKNCINQDINAPLANSGG